MSGSPSSPSSAGRPTGTPEAYERPRVEMELTAEELEREVHYAGEGTPNPG